MFYHVKKDLQFIVDSDPAARNKIELFFVVSHSSPFNL